MNCSGHVLFVFYSDLCSSHLIFHLQTVGMKLANFYFFCTSKAFSSVRMYSRVCDNHTSDRLGHVEISLTKLVIALSVAFHVKVIIAVDIRFVEVAPII